MAIQVDWQARIDKVLKRNVREEEDGLAGGGGAEAVV